MKKIYILTILILAGSSLITSNNIDINSSTLEIIKRAGYPAESHLVTTEDGYILTMHRIPGKSGSIPIFLQHALCGSSSIWVLTGRDKALGFILADRGYDVWMGNLRGNSYSNAHVNLSIENSAFWQFSMHELGVYDLPAQLSYINNLTSQRVIYIGYSLGSTIGVIVGCERPDIDKYIRLMIHYGAACYLKHLRGTAKFFAPFTNEAKFITDLIGLYEVPPKNHWIRSTAAYLCSLNSINLEICKEIVFFVTGFDNTQMNYTTIPLLYGHVPDSTASNVIYHYGQWVGTDYFRQFDYGFNENVRRYNRTSPPDYDVTRMRVPTALFYSEFDWYATTEDIRKLYSLVQSPAGLFKVNYTKFTHLEFVTAIDAPTLLYDDTIALIEKYND